MKRGGKMLICMLAVMATLTPAERIIPPEEGGDGCEGYRSLLTRVMVRFGATYFADNPRSNATEIDPSQVDPPTPIELFRQFYGAAASPEHFKEAILQIYYSDPGPDGPSMDDSDKIVLRNNIYTYAQASSYELAREKFGLLLYLGISDFADSSADWLNRRCLRGEDIATFAEDVITTELERIRNSIGEFKFSSFLDLGSGTTLAFAIDDTGSMSGEIQAAKERAKLIIDEREGSLDQPQDFVLVPFNDPTVGPVTTTNNPEVFKQAIDRLYAHGGGDAPELALRGILLAVENSRQGSTVFVITDIDAKDIELQDVVVAQAKQKNIKIVFLLTNRIQTTQCRYFSRGDNELRNRRCLTTSFRKGYELFEYIAQSTGGQILVVRKSDIFRATEVIDSTVKQGVVDVDYKIFSNQEASFPVQIDSSLTEVFLKLTGDCENPIVTFGESQLTITNPILVGDLFEGRLNVAGQYGEWSVSLRAGQSCQVKIEARSTKGFVKNLGKQLMREDGQRILEIFEGQPLLTDDITILVDSYGKVEGDQVMSIEFINQDTGSILNTFNVPNPAADEFRFPVASNPTAPFYVKVLGTDRNGIEFTRVLSSPIQFVDVEINCDNIDDVVFRPGRAVNISLSVRNFGEDSASFELGATDTERYVTAGVSPSNIIVGGGEIGRARFEVVPRSSAEIGSTSVVTITARSTGLSFLLYKMCRIVVGQRLRPTVESVAVDATISSRFAQTVMTSVVFNNASVGREAEFQVILPIDAFITAFSMTIDGVTYDGRIEERARAQRIFTAARERDLSVGHVAARDSSTTVFRTSVSLEPFKRVTFRLTYQELLKIVGGRYAYGVSVVTLQPVDSFSIDVSICESEEIVSVDALGFDTDQSTIPNPIVVPGISVSRSGNTAQVSYRPNIFQQTEFSPLGLNGRFIVKYQLLSDERAGDFLVSGLNFVHFASPEVNPMPKRVIFTLDISGSMFGHKYRQLQIAMDDILDRLRPSDEFSIVLFNSSVVRWNPDGAPGILAPATVHFIEMAKLFLDEISPRGGTDILSAAEAALELLSEAVQEGGEIKPVGGEDESTPVADYIVLLTDGRSTEGTTDKGEIERNILDFNSERFGIHTIGFGTLIDAELLSTIAAQNSGTSIQIFIDIDTHVQMINFFTTIDRPLFHDVVIDFPPDRISKSSGREFDSFFGGQEITTAGTFLSEDLATGPLSITFRGKSRNSDREFPEEYIPRNIDQICQSDDFQVTNFVERLQIFLQLRDLLNRMMASSNRTERDELKEQALNTSLENGIVTPGITSLVVLKPEDFAEVESVIEEEDAAAAATTTTAPTVFTTPPSPFTGLESSFIAPFVDGFPDLADRAVGGRRRERLSPTRLPTDGSRFFGFAGDPHFIVDLGKQITICFNWQGKENEVYNIVHDELSGITVNAKLVQSKFVEEEVTPTFVGEIGLIFAQKNMSVMIDVSRVVLNIGLSKPITMPMTTKRSTKKRGIRFQILPITDALSMVVVSLKDIQFKIIARLHSTNVDIINHLDFSVPKRKGFSSKITGMLGQFPQSAGESVPASIDFMNNPDEALLSYKSNMVKVKSHQMFESYIHKTIDCWFVDHVSYLTGDDTTKYLVSGLLDYHKIGSS